MSRPSSYHDYSGASSDPYDSNGFALPLFNSNPPQPYRPSQAELYPTQHLPPPQGPGHAHRRSLVAGPVYDQTSSRSAHSPSSAGLPLSSSSTHGHRPQGSMTSTLPYASVPYPQSAHSTSSGNHGRPDELMVPSTSTSFGALARSASLGTRKKDPYAYSSDDVESGMGSMDMGAEPSSANWGGYAGTSVRAPQQQNYDRDVIMSPNRGYPTSASSNNSMQPPPAPAHALAPPNIRQDSNGSPSRPPYSHAQASSMSNPYIPRSSDPGNVSAQPQWADYRRPQTGQRMSSSSSYHSPSSEHQLSPYLPTTISPNSPMLNPYDSSPTLPPTQPLTPSHSTSASQWPPASPQRAMSYQHQLYPASQPVTPATKTYDMGPPKGLPTRDRSRGESSSRAGMRDVRDSKDLKPVLNAHLSGRRADPTAAGKYLSPLKCLTSALPQTYNLSNPQFHYETSENPRRVLTKPSKAVHNGGADNEDWDYILYVNDVLGGEDGRDRYLILDVLGQGTFGQVVKCQNMRTHDICAVKVVKNKPAYLNQSKMEVAILYLLNNDHDPHDQHHILRMYESFTHKNHLCLVFECLSSNLYELIKQNQFKGLSTQLVKVFTQQLLECLAVLKEARLIHCDLKPENILLKSLQSPQIKIIDFGSACHEMQTVYTYIQSRFYRSPEVLLGLTYTTSIDMWSLGCIVVELFLGLPLFPGTSEYNQLSRIVDMLGNPPSHLLENGKQTHDFFNHTGFDAHGRKQYTLKSMEQYCAEKRTTELPSKQYFKQTKLRDIIMEYPYAKRNPKQSDIDKEMANRTAFVDFVQGLLALDPLQRWTPQQAAKHPFITGDKFTGPFQPTAAPPRKSQPSTPVEVPTTPSSTSKKYGGLVQSPPSTRGQRIYSDAAAYNQQLAQHQVYAAQVQSASAAARQPFSPNYEVGQSPYAPAQAQRIPSQQRQQPAQGWQTMGPPQGYQPRIPTQAQGLSASTSQASMRASSSSHPHGAIMTAAATNPPPPPNSYYPASRNRANTINKMDAIPPALARLTHFGAPDPSGTRNLTPVLQREDMMREWERRQQGHSKQSSLHNASYPQLEYLQEQAELAGGWGYGHAHTSSGHYQMQPGIGIVGASPHSAHTRSEYDQHGLHNPPRSAPITQYLPAYPPPAATNNGAGVFDAFDGSRDAANMGMMYTPLQPSQAGYGYGGGGGGAGHQARASYSGPYQGGGNGSFGIGQIAPGQGNQGQGQGSPRWQRRSQGYGA